MGSLLSKELQTDSYCDKSGAAAERSREGELELVITPRGQEIRKPGGEVGIEHLQGADLH